MTQEEKELLLKDLCTRLPYDVVIHYHLEEKGTDRVVDVDKKLTFPDVDSLKDTLTDPQDDWCIIDRKPYLRPISSITDEEFQELHSICPHSTFNKTNVPGWIIGIDGSDYGRISRIDEISKLIDWLNSHHFDYHGLIEKGLALEAPEDIYKI